MTAKWGICALLLAMLFLNAGCRTRQPNLKPETTAEQLVEPPAGSDTSTGMPAQAFNKVVDPGKIAIEPRGPNGMMQNGGRSPMMPGAGGMGGGGMGGSYR